MIRQGKLFGIPLARRRTRRWLVIGYWTIIFSVVSVVSLFHAKSGTFLRLTAFGLPLIVLLLPGLLGGDGKRGAVRAFQGPTSEEQSGADYTNMTPDDITEQKRWEHENRLDERDVNLRNAVHYKAYSAVRWIVCVAFFVLADPYDRMPSFSPQPLLLLLMLAVWSLPQSIILWTEPDMETQG